MEAAGSGKKRRPLASSRATPHENESVFPPCTYLEPRGDHEVHLRLPGGEEVSVKVLEVTPHCVD